MERQEEAMVNLLTDVIVAGVIVYFCIFLAMCKIFWPSLNIEEKVKAIVFTFLIGGVVCIVLILTFNPITLK